MLVRLKGLNQTTKKLADGSTVTYYYAWKGGPRLPGKPGEPDFMDAYNKAIEQRTGGDKSTLQAVLNAFQATDHFRRKLAERTRRDYIAKIKIIEKEFGDFPLSAMTDRRTRGEFMEWRDRLAQRSPRQADYAWIVLSAALSFAVDRGMIATNPCARGGRLYDGDRSERIWTPEDEAIFIAVARAGLHLALLLAVWTGQRQGDLLRLTWSAYDGRYIRLRQSKTGVYVVIPAGRPLREVLDAEKRRSPIILLNSRGRPWSEGGFQSSFSQDVRKAGLVDLTFNDLRGTAVTRLALAGATEPEIATITGHTLKQVRSILDKHYLHRDVRLAESAIRKLEKGTEIPN